jgi:hypothetical protein
VRLVTFGCSYTYGQGLEDCFVLPNNPGPHPSVYAWPQLVANMLNVECVNKSAPASSNKQILDTLLQFDFNSDDIVLIMWTFTNRWCTINKLGEYTIISQYKFKTIQELELYEKLFTEEDSQIDFIYRANFAKLFLDNKNVFNYHFTVSPKMFLNPLPDNVNKWNSVKFSDVSLDDYRLMFPPALDTQHGAPHPGPLAHKFAAGFIFKEITDAHNK